MTFPPVLEMLGRYYMQQKPPVLEMLGHYYMC